MNIFRDTDAATDHARADDSAIAVVSAHVLDEIQHGAVLRGMHHLVVRDAEGRIVQVVDQPNLVTTAGKNYLLGAGLANTPAAISTWYLGMTNENRHVSDGVITGQPTTTFSSATASFVAGDVGRQITIYSGLSGPATFAGTIVSQTGTACVVSANLTLNGTSLIASVGPLLAAADTAASHAGWTAIGSGVIVNSVWPTWTPGAVAAGSVNNSGAPAVITMASSIATQYLHGMFLTSSSALATSSGTLYSELAFTGGAIVVGSSYTITDTYTLSLT